MSPTATLAADARRHLGSPLAIPVPVSVQWDDEMFPRDGQFELFDAFASEDKRLIARSGPHAESHPDDEASWQEFIRASTPAACRR
jgi:hypothetical protein